MHRPTCSRRRRNAVGGPAERGGRFVDTMFRFW